MEGNSYQPLDQLTFQPSSGGETSEKGNRQGTGRVPPQTLIVCVAGILLAALLLFLIIKVIQATHKYSVVGEWSSEDILELEEMITKTLIEETGLADWVVQDVIDLIGLDDDESLITLRFTESGNVRISIGGVSAGFGSLTYEVLGKHKILIRYQAEISALSVNVPIDLSIEVGYKVGKKQMTLELFGYKATFKRVPD